MKVERSWAAAGPLLAFLPDSIVSKCGDLHLIKYKVRISYEINGIFKALLQYYCGTIYG